MKELPLVAVAGLMTFFGLWLVLRPRTLFNLKTVRETYHPKLLSSPSFRLQMRVMGALFTLFGFLMLAGVGRQIAPAIFPRSFEGNVHVALLVIFFAVWFGTIGAWILKKLRLIPDLKERYDSVSGERDAVREQTETRWIFGSVVAILLLSFVISIVTSP
jgi:hypothetical protein